MIHWTLLSSICGYFKVLRSRRKLRNLDRSYNERVVAAEQQGEFDWAADLRIDQGMETAELFDVCHRSDTAKLRKQAARLGIWLEKDVPRPRGEYSHWDQDPRRPDGILHWQSFRSLQSIVNNARKERSLRRRETLKVVSPAFNGIASIIVAFASWITKH